MNPYAICTALLVTSAVLSRPTYRWLINNMPTSGISNPTFKKFVESVILAAAATVFFTVPLLPLAIFWQIPAACFAACTCILFFGRRVDIGK